MHSRRSRLVPCAVLLIACHVACHRPIEPPEGPIRYRARPVTPDRRLERFLAEYGPTAAGPEDTGDAVLDPPRIRRLAVANSPGVITARSELAEAEASLESAGAWPNPELEGKMLLDDERRPGGEGAFLFVLPLGGRVGARRDRAAAALDRARIELRSARIAALVNAECLMAGLAHARARLHLAKDLAERSSRYTALARTRQRASMADPLDVALLIADEARDRRATARARLACGAAERSLRLELGLAPGETDLATGRLERMVLREPLDTLLEFASEHHPHVLKSKLDVLVADRAAAQAAAERLPDLRAGPAFRGESGALAVGVQIGIEIPLWQSGGGPYREALAQRATAVEAHHLARRELVAGVEQAHQRVVAVGAELDELTGPVSQAVSDALELAEIRYRAGKLDVLRLLSIRRAHAAIERDYLDLLLRQAEALADLEAAVGRRLHTEEVSP